MLSVMMLPYNMHEYYFVQGPAKKVAP